MKNVPLRWLKLCLFLLSCYPLARWVYLAYFGGLTANPPEFLIRSSGIWATVLLWVTLSVTPLRRIFGWSMLVRCRRMLGLFAFFYTCLHVAGWALWERGLSLTSMGADIVQRPFIAWGVVATALLLVLALTSTNSSMRRLGRHWKTLHRSVYIIAIIVMWHFYLIRAGKNDFNEVYWYAVVLLGLFLIRGYFRWRPSAQRS